MQSRYVLDVNTDDLISLLQKLRDKYTKLILSQNNVTQLLRLIVNRISSNRYSIEYDNGYMQSRTLSQEELDAVEKNIHFFLSQFSSDANIRIIEAQYYARQKQVSKALILYKKALNDFPDNPWLIKKLAILSKKTGLEVENLEVPREKEVPAPLQYKLPVFQPYQLFGSSNTAHKIGLLFQNARKEKSDGNFSLFSSESFRKN